MEYRECVICGSNKTKIENDIYERWYKYDNGFICYSCYYKAKNKKLSELRAKNRKSVLQRFWDKVDKKGEDECWEWKGSKDSSGYGHFSFYGVIRKTNRIVYELTYGKIQNDLQVLHKCDNRACVNPNHLFLGTNYDNIKDRMNKGRGNYLKGDNSRNHILTIEKACKIRELYGTGKYYQEELAKIFNVGQTTISEVITNKRW